MQMEMEHSGTEDGGEGEGLKLVQGEEEEEKRVLKPEMGEEVTRNAGGKVESRFSVSEAWEPVKKALEEGADYVEVDVWLVDGELLVSTSSCSEFGVLADLMFHRSGRIEIRCRLNGL